MNVYMGLLLPFDTISFIWHQKWMREKKWVRNSTRVNFVDKRDFLRKQKFCYYFYFHFLKWITYFINFINRLLDTIWTALDDQNAQCLQIQLQYEGYLLSSQTAYTARILEFLDRFVCKYIIRIIKIIYSYKIGKIRKLPIKSWF